MTLAFTLFASYSHSSLPSYISTSMNVLLPPARYQKECRVSSSCTRYSQLRVGRALNDDGGITAVKDGWIWEVMDTASWTLDYIHFTDYEVKATPLSRSSPRTTSILSKTLCTITSKKQSSKRVPDSSINPYVTQHGPLHYRSYRNGYEGWRKERQQDCHMHPPRLSSYLHTSHYYLILIYLNIYLNSSSPITIP
jgi:hypothetical protein